MFCLKFSLILIYLIYFATEETLANVSLNVPGVPVLNTVGVNLPVAHGSVIAGNANAGLISTGNANQLIANNLNAINGVNGLATNGLVTNGLGTINNVNGLGGIGSGVTETEILK